MGRNMPLILRFSCNTGQLPFRGCYLSRRRVEFERILALLALLFVVVSERLWT